MTQNLNCKMLAALCLAVLLVGCSTSKEEMLPTGDHTMLELWNGSDGEGEPLVSPLLQGTRCAAR